MRDVHVLVEKSARVYNGKIEGFPHLTRLPCRCVLDLATISLLIISSCLHYNLLHRGKVAFPGAAITEAPTRMYSLFLGAFFF